MRIIRARIFLLALVLSVTPASLRVMADEGVSAELREFHFSAATAAECKAPSNSERGSKPSYVTAEGQPKTLSSESCVHRAYWYYEYPGGPECGVTFIYCDDFPYHEGCKTQYYDVYAGCGCL